MTSTDAWLLVWLAAIAAVVAAMSARGCLRADAFDPAPPRRVDLTLLDLLIGALIMFAGVAVLTVLHSRFGPAMDQESDPPSTVAWTLASQGLTQLSVVAFVLWRTRGGGWRDVGLWPRRPYRELLAGGLALPAAIVLALGFSAISVSVGRWFGQPEPDSGHVLLTAMLSAQEVWVVLMLLFSAVVVAPLLEEVIFRGLIQTALRSVNQSRNRWLVVIISAALFALFHGGVPWQVRLSLFVLGIILGWLYERYGSLLPSLIVHAGFNAANTALALAIGE